MSAIQACGAGCLDQLGASPLMLRPATVAVVCFTGVHKIRFDRYLLIAQAMRRAANW